MVELATDVRSEEPVEPVSLAEVANDVATRFRRRTGTEITVDVDDAGTVDGRRAMLDRAVSNLVDNALKFSPDGEAVDVTVHGGDASRSPTVGPASTPTTARGCSTASTAPPARARCPAPGLGLSIVSQIAELHGGTVTLDARDGGGTVARLQLPACRRLSSGAVLT